MRAPAIIFVVALMLQQRPALSARMLKDTINEVGTITGTDNADTITGSNQDDTIDAKGGNDVVNAGQGADTIDGGTGVDTMNGGTGDDTMIVDDSSDVINENVGEGTDKVKVAGAGMTYTMPDNVENTEVTQWATVVGNSGNNNMRGGDDSDTLSGGAGNDNIDGAGGNGGDTMNGDAGDDIINVDNDDDVVSGGPGTDKVNVFMVSPYNLPADVENGQITGEASDMEMTGNALNNVITGNAFRSVLRGGDGDDVLNNGGQTGNDYTDILYGGQGNDIFIADGNDEVHENSGEGVDTMASLNSFTLPANVENGNLTGSDQADITGNADDNVLAGNGGDNNLKGGGGADVMIGGDGQDTFQVDSADDVVVEAPNQGSDTVVTFNLSYQLPATVEDGTISESTNVPNTTLNGTEGGNWLVGNAIANVINGGAGDDTIDGGGGGDTMAGGPGNDEFKVSNAAQVVLEAPGEGTDFIASTVSVILPSNVEQGMLLDGSGPNNMTGNAGNNGIYGNTESNTLVGGDGDDKLVGGGGSDRLVGGRGNDAYLVSTVGAAPTIVENTGEGTDNVTVQAAVTVTLATNVDNLLIRDQAGAVSGTGNDGTNTITGNSAANSLFGGGGNDVLSGGGGNDNLFGGTGADRMVGGAGNDVFEVDNTGDTVVENAGEGTDTVKTNGVTFTLPANVETGIVTGTANTGITGNTLNNNVTGNSGKNALNGLDGNDNLVGGSGNDTLSGGAGNDVITGGTGSDILTGGTGTNTFVFLFGDSTTAGYDTITDFKMGTDKIKIMTSATAKYTITGFTRSNDLTAASSAFTIASKACQDANGLTAGAQVLSAGKAALVYVGGTNSYKGLYIVINKSVTTTLCTTAAQYTASSHMIIKVAVSPTTALLPPKGTITPSTWFL